MKSTIYENSSRNTGRGNGCEPCFWFSPRSAKADSSISSLFLWFRTWFRSRTGTNARCIVVDELSLLCRTDALKRLAICVTCEGKQTCASAGNSFYTACVVRGDRAKRLGGYVRINGRVYVKGVGEGGDVQSDL
jgi:hypothetical protein